MIILLRYSLKFTITFKISLQMAVIMILNITHKEIVINIHLLFLITEKHYIIIKKLLLLDRIFNYKLYKTCVEFGSVVLTANTQAIKTTTRHTRSILNCKIMYTSNEM